MNVLESTTNPFGGVISKPEVLPEDPEQFRQQLRHSLSAWTAEGFKVVWLEVPIARAGLVPVAVEAGFTYHHSGDDYLMLIHRLVEGAFVPAYASHYIGAGGAAINDKQELLVVQEKVGGLNRRRFYKLPGGAIKEGEHLQEGVVREVYEETGVRTRFDALVCLRNLHGYRYGKSDIYFVCRLTPLTHEISIQAEEIEECFWMPVGEYLTADTVGAFNKRIVEAVLKSPGLTPTFIEGHRTPEAQETFMPVDSARDLSAPPRGVSTPSRFARESTAG